MALTLYSSQALWARLQRMPLPASIETPTRTHFDATVWDLMKNGWITSSNPSAREIAQLARNPAEARRLLTHATALMPALSPWLEGLSFHPLAERAEAALHPSMVEPVLALRRCFPVDYHGQEPVCSTEAEQRERWATLSPLAQHLYGVIAERQMQLMHAPEAWARQLARTPVIGPEQEDLFLAALARGDFRGIPAAGTAIPVPGSSLLAVMESDAPWAAQGQAMAQLMALRWTGAPDTKLLSQALYAFYPALRAQQGTPEEADGWTLWHLLRQAGASPWADRNNHYRVPMVPTMNTLMAVSLRDDLSGWPAMLNGLTAQDWQGDSPKAPMLLRWLVQRVHSEQYHEDEPGFEQLLTQAWHPLWREGWRQGTTAAWAGPVLALLTPNAHASATQTQHLNALHDAATGALTEDLEAAMADTLPRNPGRKPRL